MSISLTDVQTSLSSAHPGAQVDRRGEATLVDATHDSRRVGPGWLFCAVAGDRVDGHAFAGEAERAGATALLVERWLSTSLPQLRVPWVRAAMGPVAAAVHDRPSDDLLVVGVTGTNGKTTVSYLLEAAFGAAGLGTGVVGTIATRIHGAVVPGARTTPEATDLQRLLADMRARGVGAVALEASSHGLDQRRLDATAIDVAVFTNLSRDHLDYHDSFEDYFAAKARLFTPAMADRGIVCVDDDWGRRLADEAEVPVLTYGSCSDDRVQPDARVVDIVSDPGGSRFRVRTAGDEVDLRTRLLGEHNAMNAAAAYLAATTAGVPAAAARAGIAACEGVPGRFEPIEVGQPFTVIVDYAHSPDALSRAVAASRRLLTTAAGTVHVVVGCGGDRDRAKRPVMGRIAAEAGHAVLTSDNPRSEDPDAILAEVVDGARQVDGAGITVEVDRRRAIAAAVAAATPGDVVLIAGKGHETGQEIAGHTTAFDDREVARQALREGGFVGPGGRGPAAVRRR